MIASNNAHKVREIRQILGAYFSSMDTLKDAGVDIDVDETGETFEENAVLKAETILNATGYDAALADDSGLVVDALNGAPGVYSARFAGEGHNDQDNNAKLMREMQNVPDEQRTCRFVSAIALARRGLPTITVRGACEGVVLHEARGENGFGYDPYFWYAPFEKSFAELSADEKNSVSHRKRALEKLKTVLDSEKK